MAEELDPSLFEELNPDDFEEVGAVATDAPSAPDWSTGPITSPEVDAAAESMRGWVQPPPPPPMLGPGDVAGAAGMAARKAWDRSTRGNGIPFGEMAVREVNNALTLGFGDEAVAGLQALGSHVVGPKVTYDQALAGERARLDQGREEYPYTSKAIGVGASLPIGAAEMAIAKAMGLIRAGLVPARVAAGTAGVTGGVAGLGNSTAPTPTRSIVEDPAAWGRFAAPVAIGAGTGAAVSGALTAALNRYAAGAPARLTEQTVDDILEGSPMGSITEKKRFGGAGEFVTRHVNEQPNPLKLRADIRDQQKLPDVMDWIQTQKSAIGGARRRELYEHLDQGPTPFTAGEIMGHIRGIIRRDEGVGGVEAWQSALESVEANVEKTLLNSAAQKAHGKNYADLTKAQARDLVVPSEQVRAWVTNLLKHTNTTMGALDETSRWGIRNKLYNEVGHDLFKGHLDAMKDATAAVPWAPRRSQAIKNAYVDAVEQERVASELGQINEKLAALEKLEAPIAERLKAAKYQRKTLDQKVQKAIKPAAIAAGGGLLPTVLGSPDKSLQMALGAGGLWALYKGAQAGDRVAALKLAQLVTAAKQGNQAAQTALTSLTGTVPATIGTGAAGAALNAQQSAGNVVDESP